MSRILEQFKRDEERANEYREIAAAIQEGRPHVPLPKMRRRVGIGLAPPARTFPTTPPGFFDRYEERCYLCGTSLTATAFEIEHIIPTALGGTDDPENLAPACQPCNGSKGTRIVSFMVATRKPTFQYVR